MTPTLVRVVCICICMYSDVISFRSFYDEKEAVHSPLQLNYVVVTRHAVLGHSYIFGRFFGTFHGPRSRAMNHHEAQWRKFIGRSKVCRNQSKVWSMGRPMIRFTARPMTWFTNHHGPDHGPRHGTIHEPFHNPDDETPWNTIYGAPWTVHHGTPWCVPKTIWNTTWCTMNRVIDAHFGLCHRPFGTPWHTVGYRGPCHGLDRSANHMLLHDASWPAPWRVWHTMDHFFETMEHHHGAVHRAMGSFGASWSTTWYTMVNMVLHGPCHVAFGTPWRAP